MQVIKIVIAGIEAVLLIILSYVLIVYQRVMKTKIDNINKIIYILLIVRALIYISFTCFNFVILSNGNHDGDLSWNKVYQIFHTVAKESVYCI